MNRRRTVLVTGAAGFMGSAVVDELIRLGRRVVALDDLSGGFRDNVHPVAEFVKGSITDHRLIDRLFRRHRFADVYHLAAYAAEGLSHFIKRFNYENNLIGSVNLMNASVNAGVRCFVFTSSIAVYGRNRLPFREDLTPHPEDPYGIAKHAVEQELAISNALFGLNYIVFRPHNVYGERQHLGDPYRNVIGIFMRQILANQPLTIFGSGRQTRAFTHIQDVAPVIARAPFVRRAYGEIFNLGADTPCSINALAQAVRRAMGRAHHPMRHLPPRHEVVHAYADHTKVARYFGDRPRVSLEAGLARMAQWARQHGIRASRPFAAIEIRQGLPPSWRALSA